MNPTVTSVIPQFLPHRIEPPWALFDLERPEVPYYGVVANLDLLEPLRETLAATFAAGGPLGPKLPTTFQVAICLDGHALLLRLPCPTAGEYTVQEFAQTLRGRDVPACEMLADGVPIYSTPATLGASDAELPEGISLWLVMNSDCVWHIEARQKGKSFALNETLQYDHSDFVRSTIRYARPGDLPPA